MDYANDCFIDPLSLALRRHMEAEWVNLFMDMIKRADPMQMARKYKRYVDTAREWSESGLMGESNRNVGIRERWITSFVRVMELDLSEIVPGES